MSAQSNGTVLGGPLIIAIPQSSIRLEITLPSRTVALSELQRHKRQFVTIHKKALTTGMAGRAEMNWTDETVAKKFASHLEENLL
jgi:protein KTI12